MTTAIVLIVALLAAMLLLWWAGRREGRKSALAEGFKRTAEEAREGHEIDESVHTLTDAELDAELLRKRKR